MTPDGPIPIDQLVRFSAYLLRNVQATIATMLEFDPEVALQRMIDPKKDPNNQPLRIDYYAEDFMTGKLQRKFKSRLCAVGEESFKQRPELKDITGCKEVFAIMDIIDGTDLLLRRFGNWCSAIVFFYPLGEVILLSMVADHEGNIFFATKDRPGAFLCSAKSRIEDAAPLGDKTRPATREDAFVRLARRRPSGPLPNTPLKDASVCFVGQKPPHFLSAAEHKPLREKLNDICKILEAETLPAPACRIYNMGGIPMMLKVASGLLESVVSFKRSKPHDFVAGAHIALRAGAYLGDTQGRPILESDLAMWLNHPEEKRDPYILACTQSLYNELLQCLKSPTRRVQKRSGVVPATPA